MTTQLPQTELSSQASRDGPSQLARQLHHGHLHWQQQTCLGNVNKISCQNICSKASTALDLRDINTLRVWNKMQYQWTTLSWRTIFWAQTIPGLFVLGGGPSQRLWKKGFLIYYAKEGKGSEGNLFFRTFTKKSELNGAGDNVIQFSLLFENCDCLISIVRTISIFVFKAVFCIQVP